MTLETVKKWSLAYMIGKCVRKARQIPSTAIRLGIVYLASEEGWA